MAWTPLAVALVSSGSRGNKLLFYHSGVTRPQSLENELLSNLPQRTLSEILAPCAVMRDKKFELRVDEWKFVGHPFSLQTSSWSVSFNIAFVLQATCSPDVVRSYDNLSRALGVAAIHEEHRVEFLKNQVFLLMQIAEEVDTINDLSERAVVSSPLAKTLWEVLCGLQSGEPHVHVKMNNWSEISTLIHSDEMETVKVKRKRTTVRSYSAVILLTGNDTITDHLPSSCNPSFHRFLATISPVKSLNQVSLDADIPLQQAVKFASHLVHWGQAMTVYPLSETNVYITSPTANIQRDSELSHLFSEEFPNCDTLSGVLFHFSSPITLAEMRDLYTDETKLIRIVTWLLQQEQILQLHTYIYLVPPQEDEPMFQEDAKNLEVLKEHLENLKQNLTEEEVSWVVNTDAASDEEDLAQFTKLSCYFHGNHHLEEILMLENMTRSQLLSLIDKFSEILTTASFPEHI